MHLAYTCSVSPSSVVWSELGLAPSFPPTRVLEVYWSRARSLVCEVALSYTDQSDGSQHWAGPSLSLSNISLQNGLVPGTSSSSHNNNKNKCFLFLFLYVGIITYLTSKLASCVRSQHIHYLLHTAAQHVGQSNAALNCLFPLCFCFFCFPFLLPSSSVLATSRRWLHRHSSHSMATSSLWHCQLNGWPVGLLAGVYIIPVVPDTFPINAWLVAVATQCVCIIIHKRSILKHMKLIMRAGLHYGGEGLRSVKNAWSRHGYIRQMVDVLEKN